MNIPIELINHILRKRLSRPATLYCYLLYNTSGNFDIKSFDKQKALSDLHIKKWETLRRQLKKLIELGWIYPKNNVLYIKGMTSLTMELDPISSMGALFDPPNFTKFKGFLIAASIAYGHLLKKRQGKYSVPIRGETTGKPVSYSYLPTGQITYTCGDEVANIYLAKSLGFSKTTGGNFKKRAKLCQYIDVKPNYVDMRLSAVFLEATKKSYPEIAHKMVSRRNNIYLQLPDRVKSHIKLRKIKSLRRLLPYNKLRLREGR